MPRLRRRLPRSLLPRALLALQLRGRHGGAGGQRAAADRWRRRPRARRLGTAPGRDARRANRPPHGRLLSRHQLCELRGGGPRRPRTRARPAAGPGRVPSRRCAGGGRRCRPRRNRLRASRPRARQRRLPGPDPHSARQGSRLRRRRNPRRDLAGHLRPAPRRRRRDRIHGPRRRRTRHGLRGLRRRRPAGRRLRPRLRGRPARRPHPAARRRRRHRRRPDPRLRPARHAGGGRRGCGDRLPRLPARRARAAGDHRDDAPAAQPRRRGRAGDRRRQPARAHAA